MKLYTVADLNKGAGVFDHVMRSANEYSSKHTEMPRQVAIGIVAAGMKSGLKKAELEEVFQSYFDNNTAALLERVQGMYLGNDRRLHLWNVKKDKTFSLDPQLSFYARPDWRLDSYSAVQQF
ncbi:MAG: hypothetical protein EOP21_05685 [Hyphomicrobiales bacterium]|nr:MAG: hypothetical protein EOP21_05685 [Hyphomicrobiales bacterium]